VRGRKVDVHVRTPDRNLIVKMKGKKAHNRTEGGLTNGLINRPS
jgi:hypothetical protein